MVKINKMIKKKTGRIYLVVYVIYGYLMYTDKKKLCPVYSAEIAPLFLHVTHVKTVPVDYFKLV